MLSSFRLLCVTLQTLRASQDGPQYHLSIYISPILKNKNKKPTILYICFIWFQCEGTKMKSLTLPLKSLTVKDVHLRCRTLFYVHLPGIGFTTEYIMCIGYLWQSHWSTWVLRLSKPALKPWLSGNLVITHWFKWIFLQIMISFGLWWKRFRGKNTDPGF